MVRGHTWTTEVGELGPGLDHQRTLVPVEHKLRTALPKAYTSALGPSLPNSYWAPVSDASHQTFSKNKMWTQACQWEDRLPKAITSPKTPKTHYLNMVLPFRETRSSSTHQNTETSSSNHETFIRYWSKSPQGTASTTKRSYDFPACPKENPNNKSNKTKREMCSRWRNMVKIHKTKQRKRKQEVYLKINPE